MPENAFIAGMSPTAETGKKFSGTLEDLRRLLRERLDVIADHALRDRDPAAQLAKLGEISGRLSALHAELKPSLPAQLNHFLERSSFQKALAFLDGADV
jgi:hypothetical protein